VFTVVYFKLGERAEVRGGGRGREEVTLLRAECFVFFGTRYS
jgi:hypothetical protein